MRVINKRNRARAVDRRGCCDASLGDQLLMELWRTNSGVVSCGICDEESSKGGLSECKVRGVEDSTRCLVRVLAWWPEMQRVDGCAGRWANGARRNNWCLWHGFAVSTDGEKEVMQRQ